ncbi:MAG: hypothetical protein GQ527_08975 [Bacteroidales bacterium]|nr:hypothetical protein [Bacteroidales bacterium]
MIISTHLPKTAGSSFSSSLKGHFGESNFREDYGDWPINTPKTKRNYRALRDYFFNQTKDYSGVECIHGHFLTLKYLGLRKKPNTQFVTWLRDPIQRMASHYYFWKRTYHAEKSPILQRKMVEENWTLERFCLGNEVRNFYSSFLWGFPLKRFDFIGITEHYKDDLAWFSKNILQANLETKNENINTIIGDQYQLSEKLKKEIEQWHSKDIQLYKEALLIRSARF